MKARIESRAGILRGGSERVLDDFQRNSQEMWPVDGVVRCSMVCLTFVYLKCGGSENGAWEELIIDIITDCCHGLLMEVCNESRGAMSVITAGIKGTIRKELRVGRILADP